MVIRTPLSSQALAARLTGRAFSRLAPYWYQIGLLIIIPVAMFLDIHTENVLQQDVLGFCCFILLFGSLRFSSPMERRQVWVMVGVATCVEIWSSVIWGVYRYRFHNMPLWVPWGHGLVYLFALRAVRTPLMVRYGQLAGRLAFAVATGWAIFGLTLEPLLLGRLDVLGAIFWPIFAWFMRKPNAPMFAAAFLVTAILELVGTSVGNWAWAVQAPVSHIPSGNPPSVISAGYCLMDYMSLSIAASLPAGMLVPRVLARLGLVRPRVSMADSPG